MIANIGKRIIPTTEISEVIASTMFTILKVTDSEVVEGVEITKLANNVRTKEIINNANGDINRYIPNFLFLFIFREAKVNY